MWIVDQCEASMWIVDKCEASTRTVDQCEASTWMVDHYEASTWTVDQCEASTWIVTVRRPHGLLISVRHPHGLLISVRQHAVEDFSLWCVIYYLLHWLLILHSVQALPWFIGNNFMDHVSVQVSLILKVISIWMNCVGILTLYLFLQWW